MINCFSPVFLGKTIKYLLVSFINVSIGCFSVIYDTKWKTLLGFGLFVEHKQFEDITLGILEIMIDIL